MSKKHSAKDEAAKPSETPGASSIQEPAEAPVEASPAPSEAQAQPAETAPSQEPPAASPEGLPAEGQPTAEELAQLPGGNPPGSVSGEMRNGEVLTVPDHVEFTPVAVPVKLGLAMVGADVRAAQLKFAIT